MEDLDIAKGLLSEIIGEKIVEISMRPQETMGRSVKFQIIILRLDFHAIIKTKTGEHKKVLIELQKGKEPEDILRFRKYLGTNYQKQDEVKVGRKLKKTPLPIITIYFLGFNLQGLPTPAAKIEREYIDLITQQPIKGKEAFVEKLTHDCFIIQIRRLDKDVETELERILQIFNQSYVVDDRKLLVFDEAVVAQNKLLQQMTQRLHRAATDEAFVRKLDLITSVEKQIEERIRREQQLEKKINQMDRKISKAEQKLTEVNQELSEKDQELSEKDRIIAELKAKLENKQKDKP